MKSMSCSCQYCSEKQQYHVNIAAFQNKRLNGISGILRVKNDAEFLAEAIDSCIGALDELIIVYNDCSDESPQIIKEKALQYSKIKCYEYKPKVYANNLSEEEYEFIKAQPADSPHLLANYYNYALSKVNYKYVMKIDADQIYFSDELQLLCDAYRNEHKLFINPYKLLCFVYFYINLLIYKKSGFALPYKSSYLFQRYREVLLLLVRNFKIPVYLSGYNMFYKDDLWYVSLGKKNDGKINILPPYNGVTDHSVFALSAHTYFAPIEMQEYARLNFHKRSVIEVLCGVNWAFPYGFMWMHLNGIRRNIYQQQMNNFMVHHDRFLLFNDFVEKKFKDVNCTLDLAILPLQSRLLYSALHDVSDYKKIEKNVATYFVETVDEVTYLKKRI